MTDYDHLDRDALIRLLQRRDAERQLGLVWERDEIEADHALNDDFVALQLDAALSHGDAPWHNLIIEGDNYDALRALRMSHKGGIRCIYIDPPYNTGNRDFVYNDKFVDRTHRFRHSLWLEFMYKRLTLAKELLADDGVIFVSIDDNEMFRLGMLMDRIFVEDNKLAVFVWETDGTFDNQATIKSSHEYILCYAKNIELFSHPTVVDPNISDESKLFRPEIRNSIVKNGPKNPVSNVKIPAGFPAEFESGILVKRDDAWPHFDRDVTVENWKTTSEVIVSSGWANKRLLQLFIDNRFTPILDGKGQKTRFSFTANGAIENIKDRESPSYVLSVLRNFGNVRSESIYLKTISVDFSYPKPSFLLKYFYSLVNDKSAIFMDFFAGSGTSAEAIAKLNHEDGGNRRFILVSSTEATEDEPDKNLCRDVCAERVRRVMGGYINAKGEAVPGLGGGFAYLRTRRVPRHRLNLKLEHGEIWSALQLMHERPLLPWPGAGFAANGRLGYLADFHDASVAALRAWLGAGEHAPVDDARGDETPADDQGAGRTVYSWAPARLQALAPKAEWRAIPQHLRERFGR